MHGFISSLKLTLLHLDEHQAGSEWNYDRIISPFSRIYLVTAGKAWVYHSGQEFELRPGWLYLIPAFTDSRYHCQTRMEHYYIHLVDEMEGGISIFDVTSFLYQTPALENDVDILKRLMSLHPGKPVPKRPPTLYDTVQTPPPGQSFGNCMETQGILLQILSRFVDLNGKTHLILSERLHQMGHVLRYIHNHLHQKITIEGLATMRNQHPDHFSRQFLKITGVRPSDYINGKRMERSQMLLTTTSLPLREIAERVGIENMYYFSRLFKQRFGLPPGRYRQTVWKV